jgi:hypothetical protein
MRGYTSNLFLEGRLVSHVLSFVKQNRLLSETVLWAGEGEKMK